MVPARSTLHGSPRAKPEALRYRAEAHRGSRKGGMSTVSPPPRPEKPVTIRCLKSSKLPNASWGYALASSWHTYAFAPGNVRVTLDARMRSCRHPESFFDPSRLLVPYALDAVVLEVKYDAYLPDIVRDAIQVPGAVRVAHSKYALARRFE